MKMYVDLLYCTLYLYWWSVPLDNDLGMSWQLLYLSQVIPSVNANLVHSSQLHSKWELSHHVLNLFQARHVHFAHTLTWPAVIGSGIVGGPGHVDCAVSIQSLLVHARSRSCLCSIKVQTYMKSTEQSVFTSQLNYLFTHGCKVTCFHPYLMGPVSLVCASMVHC